MSSTVPGPRMAPRPGVSIVGAPEPDRTTDPNETAGSPTFRNGARPAPESRGRLFVIHAVAVFGLAFTSAYLIWRIGAGTVNLAVWWISIPLIVAELHNAFGLALFTVALWDVDGGPQAERLTDAECASAPSLRVAVLIPTYNEPIDVLLPTIAASVALAPRHETWVLDDGRRAEVRDLAARLGARYLTRADNSHAKAGNLNNALGIVEADIVAILDADHVPTADFLLTTLPYFADPAVAFVQTPQDFYNLDSFEHQRGSNDSVFNEESVFYRVIAPAKNRWQAPFWCGTCALVRTAALRDVGGVATESVTEDIHTSIRMFRAGWNGVYHNEVLARGLAPDDATSYLLQRNRWALGAMQVLRFEDPLFRPGLTLPQRLAFMTTLFAWFDSWRTFAYLVIPIGVVASGAVPILAPGSIFGPFFVGTLTIQFVALRLLARGHYPPVLSVLFEVLRMPAVLPATLAIIFPTRQAKFKVTPKGRQGDDRKAVPVPRLHSALALGSAAGLVWFTASLAGLTPVHYSEIWAATGAALFMAMNLGFLLAAIGRIRSSRFAGNRRASVRLPVQLPGLLAGRPVELLDLSLTGARVAGSESDLTFPAGDGELEFDFDLHGGSHRLRVRPRRLLISESGGAGSGGAELGLEFAPDQEAMTARLAVAIFQGLKAPEFVADMPVRRSRRRRDSRAA
ncbi:MAG: glycosyltransferase [Chloroflexota bacterium]